MLKTHRLGRVSLQFLPKLLLSHVSETNEWYEWKWTHSNRKRQKEQCQEKKRKYKTCSALSSRPETPSWVPLARRASFAWEPISCVWLTEGRVCVCMCVCICTLGVAVQRGLGLFCLLGGKGMPKSNTVNRMRSERDREQIHGEDRDRRQKPREQQTQGANKRKEEGTPAKNRTRDWFFICCHWRLPTAFLLLLFAFQRSGKVEEEFLSPSWRAVTGKTIQAL